MLTVRTPRAPLAAIQLQPRTPPHAPPRERAVSTVSAQYDMAITHFAKKEELIAKEQKALNS